MNDVSRQLTVPRPRRFPLARRPLLAGAAVLGLLALAYLGFLVWRMSYVPSDLDLSTTRPSETGLYRATIMPSAQPVPINRLHTWTLHVETADGQPLTAASIAVDGDMPQHGHGMPTRPQITQNLGNGDYLVDGMKFQMGGWWVIDFTIDDGDRSDKVSFNLLLQQ